MLARSTLESHFGILFQWRKGYLIKSDMALMMNSLDCCIMILDLEGLSTGK